MEWVALAPDVILASGTTSVVALQQATRTVPIVFVQIIDPGRQRFLESFAPPGGKFTGFSIRVSIVS
jgi:putative ABC transport system substrate-binding protein